MRLDVIRCPGHPDAVDLVVGDPAEVDPIHLPGSDWQEFKEAIKAGKFDDLTEP